MRFLSLNWFDGLKMSSVLSPCCEMDGGSDSGGASSAMGFPVVDPARMVRLLDPSNLRLYHLLRSRVGRVDGCGPAALCCESRLAPEAKSVAGPIARSADA